MAGTDRGGGEMTTRNDGGPAFPRRALSGGDHGYPVQSDGMSLRDWFAGQAMNAVVIGVLTNGEVPKRSDDDRIARTAYQLADAMLAAREKEGR